MSPISMLAADTSVEFTSTVVSSGIIIVVGVLLLLIAVFVLFGKIVPGIERRAKAREEKSAAKKVKRAENKQAQSTDNNIKAPVTNLPLPKPAPMPSPVVEQGISGEVVAAITAAIVATEGQGAVIRSIKRKNVGSRNPWAQAAVIDNTRPF